MDKPIGILALAKLIIAQYGKHGISPAKLQTLAYYVKAWSLVGAHPIITEPFRRQRDRPVNDLLQETYGHFGSDNIPISEGALFHLSLVQDGIFQFVLDHYTQLSQYTLSELMHSEMPLRTTLPDGMISDTLIFSYYSEQPFAQNIDKIARGEKIVPYYKLETDAHYAFVMDMDAEDAEMVLKYPSYDIYKERQKRAKQDVARLWDTLIA